MIEPCGKTHGRKFKASPAAIQPEIRSSQAQSGGNVRTHEDRFKKRCVACPPKIGDRSIDCPLLSSRSKAKIGDRSEWRFYEAAFVKDSLPE